MNTVAATQVQPPVLPEQSITASLTAEIMRDLDDGQPTLVAATESNLGDLQEVTASQLLAKVKEQREQLDRIEALANQWATHVLQLFIEQYGIEMFETSLDGLAEINPELAAGFLGYRFVPAGGPVTIVLAEGLNPALRLGIVRDLVRSLQEQA